MRTYTFDNGGGGQGRRWIVGVGALLAVGLLVAGAYVLGAHAGTAVRGTINADQPAPAAPPTTAVVAPVEPGTPPVAEPTDDPVTTAQAWMRAYWARSASDLTASSWIDRVQPVIGDELGEEYERSRTGSSGAAWVDFVAAGCWSVVDDAAGVIPDEAPRTRTSVHVQVSGNLRSACRGSDDMRPAEPLAATLHLVRVDDGTWRVEQRLF